MRSRSGSRTLTVCMGGKGRRWFSRFCMTGYVNSNSPVKQGCKPHSPESGVPCYGAASMLCGRTVARKKVIQHRRCGAAVFVQ